MLGSQVLSVRLGGIYALARLAREYPEEYHVQIMRLLLCFRAPPNTRRNNEYHRNEDLKLRMKIIDSQLRLDGFAGNRLEKMEASRTNKTNS